MNEISKDRNLAPDQEGILKALHILSDALHLGHSESSTEELFVILADAFSPEPAAEMFDLMDESHEDSLCYDMRYPIVESICEAHANYMKAPLYDK